MKSNIITVFGLLSLLVVGCSKDVAYTDENAWIYDETLPAPIQFGTPNFGAETKAAIQTLDGMTGKAISVFAWDEGSSDKMKTSARSIFTTDYRRAQVFTNPVPSLKFCEQGQAATSVFYPMSSKYNYSFYAYHTGTENLAGTYASNEDSYQVSLDFHQPFNDVLWGKFSDDSLDYDPVTLPHLEYNSTVIKGFNSRFSRAAGKQTAVPMENYYPVINFDHLCTAFRFYAKADSMSVEKYTQLWSNMTIKWLSIDNVPASAELVVASRNSGDEGKLVVSSDTCTVKMNFADLKPTGYNSSTGVGNIMKEGNEDRFFLPPGDYSQSTVTVGLLLNSKEYTMSFPLKFEGSSVFESGKCYSFVVIFKTLEEISLLVTLSDWDESNYSYIDPE